jgi:hypothetical protein
MLALTCFFGSAGRPRFLAFGIGFFLPEHASYRYSYGFLSGVVAGGICKRVNRNTVRLLLPYFGSDFRDSLYSRVYPVNVFPVYG